MHRTRGHRVEGPRRSEYGLKTYLSGVFEFSKWEGPEPGEAGFRVAHSDKVAPLDRWTHVAGTYDGRNVVLFVDGIRQQLTDVAVTDYTNTINYCIGCNASVGDRFFVGVLDEVRISSVARSADWIAAQYLAMTDQFTSYGAIDRLPRAR